ITYRLTTPEREAALEKASIADRPYVRLANPISAERAVMRQTLLPGLLEVMALNARLRDRLWFFEVGPVYLPNDTLGLPTEPRRLAIGMAGRVAPPSWRDADPCRVDFFDLKGAVEALFSGLHLTGVSFEPVAHPTFSPGRTARTLVDGQEVGILGEIHPQVHAAFDLPPGPVCLGELDLEVLLTCVPPTYRVAAVPRFPPALQDIALVVNEAVSAADLTAVVRSAGGPLLAEVRLFDVYRGPQLPPDQKSLAFSLVFQAADRTLTDAEVEAEKRRIVEAVAKRLGARLRA
ncbi:MAG TPA: phenylalanine--tRNA ligase subunit beta, partial [archaeon]|nr:phenylalanine--tRNA ligase subunit beta [archaeon]